MTPGPAALTVLRTEYPARLAHGFGLVVLDFHELVPERDGDPAPDILRALQAEAGRPEVGVLARVNNSRPPPADARDVLLRQFQALGPRLRGVHIALQGHGFVVGAFRSVISAVKMVGAIKIPLEVHTDFAGARAALGESFTFSETASTAVDRFLER